jgi:hypothetical protein
MKFSKDLRDLDEKEFRKLYTYIEERTGGFREVNEELFKENPQYIFPIRLALGLSQLNFMTKLNCINKQWIRHFEAGRQGFKQSKLYPKAIEMINELFQKGHVVGIKKTIEVWKKCRAGRAAFFFSPEEQKYEIKKISKMTQEDFIKYFGYLKKETDNFKNLDPKILVINPQFISIFRMILGLSHKNLSILLYKDPKAVRNHEYREYKVMPRVAKMYMDLFEKLMKERKIIGDVNMESALKNFRRMSTFDELEIKIKKIIESVSIDFNENSGVHAKIHHVSQINKKSMNIDFMIFDGGLPIVAIEATKLSNIKTKDLTHRIAYLDHRFQMLKTKHPNLTTMMILQCDKSNKDRARRVADREIINTDVCLINETQNLSEFLNELF